MRNVENQHLLTCAIKALSKIYEDYANEMRQSGSVMQLKLRAYNFKHKENVEVNINVNNIRSKLI